MKNPQPPISGPSRLATISLVGIVALVMIGGGIAHLATPLSFAPLVPGFLPAVPVLFVAGLVQIAIGALAIWPRSRAWGGLAFAMLCAGYLPLHLWDFFRPDPVFAPPVAAGVRVLVQLLFIAVGVALWRRARPATA